MQRRFCSCGCGVWVQYLLLDEGFHTLIWSEVGQVRQRVCACCGSVLDIDELA